MLNSKLHPAEGEMIRFKLTVREARRCLAHPFQIVLPVCYSEPNLLSARQFPVGTPSRYVDEGDTWGPLVTHNEFLFVSSLLLALALNNYTYNLMSVLDRGIHWLKTPIIVDGIIREPAWVLSKKVQVLVSLVYPCSIVFLNFLKNNKETSCQALGHLNLYSSVVHFMSWCIKKL